MQQNPAMGSCIWPDPFEAEKIVVIQALRWAGAKRIVAYAVHPVLSGPAIERLQSSAIEEVVVTNTIPLRDNARACSKIQQLSVAR